MFCTVGEEHTEALICGKTVFAWIFQIAENKDT